MLIFLMKIYMYTRTNFTVSYGGTFKRLIRLVIRQGKVGFVLSVNQIDCTRGQSNRDSKGCGGGITISDGW